MPAQPRKTASAKKTATRAQRPTPQPSASPKYGSGWQRGDTSDIGDLTLPSGNVVLVRKPGTQGLIEAGVLDKLDPLTQLVDKKIVGPATKGSDSAENDKPPTTEEIILLTEVCDRIMAWAVIEPTVKLAPTPRCKFCKWEGNDLKKHKNEDHTFDPVPREEDVVYTDAISLQDKTAVMIWATEGPAALARFRELGTEGMATVSAGQGV